MHQAVKIVEWANLINANTIKYPGMEKGKQIREIFFCKKYQNEHSLKWEWPGSPVDNHLMAIFSLEWEKPDWALLYKMMGPSYKSSGFSFPL